MTRFSIIFTIFFPFLLSCSSPERHAGAVAPVVDLASMLSDSAAVDTFDVTAPEAIAFFKTLGVDSLSGDVVDKWHHSLVVERFTPAVDSVFPSVAPIRAQLGQILASAADEGLELPRMRYAAVVCGRPEAILFVDSVMLIALNHFLGEDFEGYAGWPQYRRAEKESENMPYFMAEALVGTAYPYRAEAGEATLLSRMLYEGALAEAKLALVPGSTLAGVLGYDAETLKFLSDKERELWQQIVANRLLYTTSQMTVDGFVMPAPAVTKLDSRWPPRVGRYIGFRIVESWRKKHPEAPLSELLSPEFYNSPSVLPESGYSK